MVGGCVRDFLLCPKLVPKDIDITTDASVEKIKNLFPHSVLVGNSFGVCVLKYNGFSFEVATLRKDGPYLDRRHPSETSIGTLEDDSKRRDFTINALYFSPTKNIITDLHGGLKDLKARRLRCVGVANDRIYEDSLRILRCLRFSANFHLKIERSLLSAVKKNLDGLKEIPMERILDEISKVYKLDAFLEMYWNYLDISLFFSSLKKKTQKEINLEMSQHRPKSFVFSKRASFFNFFTALLFYYKIDDFEHLKGELKQFLCPTYDKKLCFWFISLLEPQEDSLSFFKNILAIERIESTPNKQIFRLLKKNLRDKSSIKIVNGYLKNKDLFSQKSIIQKLQSQNISSAEYSKIILRERFDNIFKR